MFDSNHYFVFGFLATIIHAIINKDILLFKDNTSNKFYQNFVFSLLFFFISDALWGVCDLFDLNRLLYVVTIFYDISLAYVTYSWALYVDDCLGSYKKGGLNIKTITGILFTFAIVCLIVNHFTGFYFLINSSGEYQTGIFRIVAFLGQIIIYAYCIIIALCYMKKSKYDSMVILAFSIICILTIIVQMTSSSLPAYSVGFLIGSCFVDEFIHDEYKNEMNLKLLAADKAKNDYLYSISHDIRTPLNAIVGYSELIQRHYDDKDKCFDYLSKIKLSSDFLLSLLNNVLELAKIESGNATINKEIWSVEAIDQEITSIFTKQLEEKKLDFKIITNIEHPYFYCDKVKLREVLLNLISNAIKYTPNGGSITISSMELFSDGDYATYEVSIADTGVGISKSFLPHIFDKFSRETTSKEKGATGTGLGLPIVKAIIDLTGSEISVSSKLGEGSTFTVKSKLKIAEKSTIINAEKIPDKDYSDKKILLVEDNEINAEIAGALLEDLHIPYDNAYDGKDALDKILTGAYDLVLMDIQMPKLNGYEVTKLVREKGYKTPIVAMTANAFEEDKQKSMDIGMNDFISKPIDTDKMKVVFNRTWK